MRTPAILVLVAAVAACDDLSTDGGITDSATGFDGPLVDASALQDAAEPLPDQPLGYDLFSWKMNEVVWCFTLVPSVNRQRFRRELVVGPTRPETQFKIVDCSIDDFRGTLSRLPRDERVLWRDESWLMGVDGPIAEFPDSATIASLTEWARSLGLEFKVMGIDF